MHKLQENMRKRFANASELLHSQQQSPRESSAKTVSITVLFDSEVSLSETQSQGCSGCFSGRADWRENEI